MNLKAKKKIRSYKMLRLGRIDSELLFTKRTL